MTYCLIAALGFVFILEGLLPFVAPNFWRTMVTRLSEQKDKSLRTMGLSSMLVGLMIILLAHFLF